MPDQPAENSDKQPSGSQINSFLPPTQDNFADETRIVGKNDMNNFTENNPSPGASTPPIPPVAQGPSQVPPSPMAGAPQVNSGTPGNPPWGAPTNPPAGFNPAPVATPSPSYSTPGVAPVAAGTYNSALPGASMPGVPQVMPTQMPGKSNGLFNIYMENFKDIWKGNLTAAFERARGNMAYAFTILGATIGLSALAGAFFSYSTVTAGGNFLAATVQEISGSKRGSSYITQTAGEYAGKAAVTSFIYYLFMLAALALILVFTAMSLSRMNREPQSTPLNFQQAVLCVSFAWFPLPIFVIPVLLLFMLPTALTIGLGVLIFLLETAMYTASAFVVLFKAVQHYASLTKNSVAQFALVYAGLMIVYALFAFMLAQMIYSS